MVQVRCFALLASLFFFSSSLFAASTLPPGAVIYGAMPTLFGDRPFADLTARLDELRGLGVDVLWIAPLNTTDDPSAVSYAITDYYGVRADFGTPAELRELIRQAHARGIKVIMDFVPNHSSKGHPWFQDAEKRGKASPTYSFYERDENGEPRYYFDWEHLPNLNYSNPGVVSALTDAFLYWLREYNVDGFRVDAAWGIRERAPGFWPELTQKLEAVNPNVIMLAEASAKDSYYCKSGFDLAYDWSRELGIPAWKDAFSSSNSIGQKLARAFSPTGCPVEQVARFLNNNDTGKRFITQHGARMTRLAAVLQHTVPGVPIVYTGDEVGAEFMPYEDPRPLVWRDPHGLRPLYQKLAGLREESIAIREGNFVPLKALGSANAFAFLRQTQGQSALVVINFGGARSLELALPAGARLRDGKLTDALTGKEKAVRLTGGRAALQMDNKSAAVFLYE